jgi:undecaprenyl-diphosphatase
MSWELKFMQWANGRWTSPALNQALPWLTHLGSHFAMALFIILSWILSGETKVFFYVVVLYAILTGVVYGLKYLIGRPRPLFLGIASKICRGPGEILDPSFPSAHTTFAFMMATLLSAWFPRYQLLFFIMAGFIGWTRLYLGLHYPTDVIAGGLLGYGITKLFLTYFPCH